MKIVFVCFYEAYPPLSGASSVTYNLAKYSQGERTVVQLGRQARSVFSTDGVKVITLVGASDDKFQKLKGLQGRIRRIIEEMRSVSPDVVILEGASWVVYHWLLLRKIKQAFPAARVVYHSHNVEYCLRREKHGLIVTLLTRWAERKILHRADLSFAVSEVDRKQFEELYGIRPGLLPNGVDYRMFEQVSESDIMSAKSKYGINDSAVLFMGSYLYKPNREAIDFLVKSVMPKVVERGKSAQLVIIGGEVPYDMPWLLKPGCIPHEQVPAFTAACRLGVAPVFSGSGTRLKILEYMAAGLPSVATSKGAEGLAIHDGLDILLAEGAEKFATCILRLLNDHMLANRVAKRGRSLVETSYSWEAITAEFNKTISAVAT